MTLAIASAQESGAVEKIDWQTNIVGSWQIDYEATAELWKGTFLEDSVDTLPMMPIFTPNLDFAASDVGFDGVPNRFQFLVKQFDSESKRLTLELEHDGRTWSMQFQVKNPDLLVLSVPATAIGPLELAYKRQSASPTLEKNNPLNAIAGEWRLDEALSKAVWKIQVPPQFLTKYSADTLRHIKKFETVRFDPFTIFYDGDQTAEPVELGISNEQTIKGRTGFYSQTAVEINVLSENMIQLSDSRRQLFAIYTRNKQRERSSNPFPDQFPVNAVANSFLQFYSPEMQPPLDDMVAPIGIDGSVEIEGLTLERKRAAVAVVHADITNMSIDLFVDVQASFQHQSGGFLIRMNELRDIKDSTGLVLTTDNRRSRIEMLRVPVSAREFCNKRDGRSGPVVGFVLDAPALGATEIQQLAGELEVFEYSTRLIRFEDVRGRVGKKLEHPLLTGLELKVDVKDGRFPELELSGNDEVRNRIRNWHVVSDTGQLLQSSSEGRNGNGISKGFSQPIPKNIALWLEITDLDPGQKFPFDFRNIKFP